MSKFKNLSDEALVQVAREMGALAETCSPIYKNGEIVGWEPTLIRWIANQLAKLEEESAAEEEPLDQRMLDHFTCRREDNAGGTPGFTLYFTKMGSHHEYQLYRNEALALYTNLGKALGISRDHTDSKGNGQ